MERLLAALLLLLAAGPADGGVGEIESATVRGRVLDPRGEPVAGAEVELRYHVGGPPWNWGSIGARTDAEGRFSSTVLPPGSTTAIARGRGWASSVPEVFRLEPDQVLEGVELALRVGGRLTGEVFDSDGRPDASCALQLRSTRESERFGQVFRADTQGFFELDALDPGTYHLAAVPEGLMRGGGGRDAAPLEGLRMETVEVVAFETVHVVLGGRSPAPVRLHGEVRFPEREPRELAIAVLGADAPGLDWLEASSVRAGGAYALVLGAPGDCLIVVGDARSGEPYAEYVRTIPATPEHRLDFELPRGVLRGRVFGPDGQGIAGVPLALHREGRPSVFDALGGRRARSRRDGEFAFERLPPGDYTLRAGVAFDGAWSPTGHAIAVSEPVRVGEGPRPVEVDLELARPGTLVGVVLDTAGRPVVGATVFVRDGAGRWLDPLSSCRTGAEGRFALEHVAPGPVTVCARTGDACSPETAPVLVREKERTEVRLVLGSGTVLHVRVAAASGAARADLRVLDDLGRDVGALRDLERVRTHLAAEILSKERDFGPLAPGTYRVIASNPDGASVEERIRLTGSPGQSLVLEY